MSRSGQIGELVSGLRALVDQAEMDWRRARLPPPSRERPRPDAESIRGAQTLEAVGRELDAMGGQLRTLPGIDVGRQGARALAVLEETDAAILAHGDFLLALLAPAKDAAPLQPDELRRSVLFLRELMQRRADLLV